MIRGSQITKSFGTINVLNSVEISILANEVVSIVGASGAGKTTLLQILSTLLSPDNGEVELLGESISRLSKKKVSQFRNRHIGFVFQFHNLLPEFTAFENVLLPSFVNKDKSPALYRKRAKELLDYMGLSDRMSHKPMALSGGEQQRVAVARALINDPEIIFGDEPTGNLDSSNKFAMYDLFKRLKEEMKQTFVIVTHDMDLSSISDRVMSMEDGRIVEPGN